MNKEHLFDKWSFVEKDWNQTDWYIKITGGKFDGLVYKYEKIKMNHTDESIDFDYEIEEYNNIYDPHGTPEFNKAAGLILRSVLEDAFKRSDYILGDKDE